VWFFLAGPDETVRDWPPPGIEPGAGWTIDIVPPTSTLEDGDVLDLGDRQLRVFHTPGHAPDHICLLDERNGILFAQDQAYYGPHLVYDDECDVAAWAASERRLADEVSGSIRQVYVAHCLRPALPPRHLRELKEAGEALLAGEPLTPAKGLLGEDVLALERGHFSVLVPAGFQA
jgi:glyoxylase-like metal-dependent hydrolase (beta-lactamase superfamily II)